MGGKPDMTVQCALKELDKFASNLICSICDTIFKSPFTFKECGHTFCRECIMTELRKKCLCPSCNVPVQVKGLHKNLTFSTLVACTSKLKDLLEAKAQEESTTQVLFDEDATQLLDGSLSPKRNVLEVLDSITDEVFDSEVEKENVQLSMPNTPVARNELDVFKAPAKSESTYKRLAKRSANTTPKVTPTANVKNSTRLKTPVSAPTERTKKSKIESENTADASTKETLKILMSGLKPDDKSLVTDYCKEVQKGVKVQIASDYDPRTVNRVIMGTDDSGLCTRTTKYLRGILDGKIIVTLTWFLDSLAQKEWLPTEQYLVKGDTSINKETNAVRLSLSGGRDKKLFSDYTFHLLGRFGTPSRQDLTTLLKSGGAKVSTARPKEAGMTETHLIIYDPDSLDDTSLWITDYKRRTSSLWVLDCISSYSILPTY